jgi:hypothetical protein
VAYRDFSGIHHHEIVSTTSLGLLFLINILPFAAFASFATRRAAFLAALASFVTRLNAFASRQGAAETE